MVAPQPGQVVNPDIFYGQVIGGIVHGASQQLGEGYIFDEATGTPLNCTVYHYQTLSAADVSEEQYAIVVDSDPAHVPTVPFHAKGSAEGIYAASWPAIAMAIYNAIGVKQRAYPFKPERILAALGKAPWPEPKGVA